MNDEKPAGSWNRTFEPFYYAVFQASFFTIIFLPSRKVKTIYTYPYIVAKSTVEYQSSSQILLPTRRTRLAGRGTYQFFPSWHCASSEAPRFRKGAVLPPHTAAETGIFLFIFCLIDSLLRIVLNGLADQLRDSFTFILELLPLSVKVGDIGQRFHNLMICLHDFISFPQNTVESDKESGLNFRVGKMGRFAIPIPALLVTLPYQRSVRCIRAPVLLP